MTDNGAAANGVYDFRFELLADGGAVGAEYVADNVTVTDGLFATTVAITGDGMWNGQRRFLRVAARADGEADFVTIGEPTEIQPAPYTFHARQAGRAAEADVATTLANVGPTVVEVGAFNMFQGGTSETMDFAARGTGMMEVTYGAGTEVGFVYLPVDVPNQVLGFEQKLAAPALLLQRGRGQRHRPAGRHRRGADSPGRQVQPDHVVGSAVWFLSDQ